MHPILSKLRSSTPQGRLLRELAASESVGGWNFLGVDIRESVVDNALRRQAAADSALSNNLHYTAMNVNAHLHSALSTYPGPVRAATAFFPDPWSRKRRYAKRRMLTAELFSTLAGLMGVGGALGVKTDVPAVAHYVRDAARCCGQLDLVACAQYETPGGGACVGDQPLSSVEIITMALQTATERELATTAQGKPHEQILFVVNGGRDDRPQSSGREHLRT